MIERASISFQSYNCRNIWAYFFKVAFFKRLEVFFLLSGLVSGSLEKVFCDIYEISFQWNVFNKILKPNVDRGWISDPSLLNVYLPKILLPIIIIEIIQSSIQQN